MRVAMLGFGLIGGSIARAVSADPSPAGWSVAAWSPSGRGPATAFADGVIQVAADSAEAALDGADLVVLAAPPATCIALLDDLAGPWRAHLTTAAVVSDVASTKSAITLRAAALGLPFVGGHPMAGRERGGYEASSPDLFVDRPWVIVPSDDPTRDGRVRDLALACGARPVTMPADAHDRAVAAISHLPLVAAAALVEAVAGGDASSPDDWSDARGLAAGGWRDMTRLARGDVAMGAGIAVTNAGPLAMRLRAYIRVLEGWAAELESPGGPDQDAIEARLRAARAHLEAAP